MISKMIITLPKPIRWWLYFMVGIWALLGTGCTSVLRPDIHSPLIHRESGSLPQGAPYRVALLPFNTEAKFQRGEAIVHKIFAAEFQGSVGHSLVPEGDILRIYQQLRILPRTLPTLEQMQIMADRFNAQILITGTVLEMREDTGQHRTVNPTLTLEIQIRDGRTGEVLWTTYHRRKGTDYNKVMHFGTIHTVSGLARQMTAEIINLWSEKGFALCNVLSQS